MSTFKPLARYSRRYTGPVKAAVLDWSGTTVDKYTIAPAIVFKKVFENMGVPVTMGEIREPMGIRKDLHIKKITEMPEVRARWRAAKGRDPHQGDVDAMYKDFIPLQLAILKDYGTLIPGTADAINTLRSKFGLKIGVTTGFARSMTDILVAEAKKQGYVPDAHVAGDEVVNGARPKPFMVYRNLDLMDIPEIHSVVKVDDCTAGLGEALSCGCWGVGVARYSNYMDISSLEEEATLSPQDIQVRLDRTRDLLIKGGAHYVVDSLADVPEVIEDINARLARGETPSGH